MRTPATPRSNQKRRTSSCSAHTSGCVQLRSGCSGANRWRYHSPGAVRVARVHAEPAEDRLPAVRRLAAVRRPCPGRNQKRSRSGEPGADASAARNHGCWSETWFGTMSTIVRMPSVARLGDQPLGLLERPEGGVDRAVVGDVVAAVGHRRRVPGAEPEGVDAEVAQIRRAARGRRRDRRCRRRSRRRSSGRRPGRRPRRATTARRAVARAPWSCSVPAAGRRRTCHAGKRWHYRQRYARTSQNLQISCEQRYAWPLGRLQAAGDRTGPVEPRTTSSGSKSSSSVETRRAVDLADERRDRAPPHRLDRLADGRQRRVGAAHEERSRRSRRPRRRPARRSPSRRTARTTPSAIRSLPQMTAGRALRDSRRPPAAWPPSSENVPALDELRVDRRAASSWNGGELAARRDVIGRAEHHADPRRGRGTRGA